MSQIAKFLDTFGTIVNAIVETDEAREVSPEDRLRLKSICGELNFLGERLRSLERKGADIEQEIGRARVIVFQAALLRREYHSALTNCKDQEHHTSILERYRQAVLTLLNEHELLKLHIESLEKKLRETPVHER